MILFIKHPYFLYRVSNLFSCPKSLLFRAEEVIACDKDIYRHRADVLDRHIGRFTVRAILDIFGGILLETLLHSILQHMLQSFHRSSLEVIIISHAVLHAYLVAD